MEDPSKEIVDVVKLITMAETPEAQQAAVEKYFAPDAGFNHPLCKVARGPNSRNRLLGIYQWYRNMSPKIELEVEEVVFNTSTYTLYLRIVQTFQVFFSPLKADPARLLVQVKLERNEDGLYFIAQQDDFYHPEDLMSALAPPLTWVIEQAKYFCTLACNFNTFVFQSFGFWRPRGTPGMTRNKTS